MGAGGEGVRGESRLIRLQILSAGAAQGVVGALAKQAGYEISGSSGAVGAIYCPDPDKATAGIHFVKVLEGLGIRQQVAPRLRAYPNGATAMRELAGSREARPIGCTQITEILNTPGVTLAGPLPTQFELATVYSAGACSGAVDPAASRNFIVLLASETTRELRRRAGFEF